MFQALCIKQQLFYGPSFNVTVAVKVQYLTPLCSPAGNRSADNHSPAEGPLWPVPPSLLVPSHPILPTAWMTSHLEKHLEVSGLPAIKAGRPPGPGATRQWARLLLAHGAPTAPRSPPSCPAASHAKDNSNSALGLSQEPLAIDGEMGSPPSLWTSPRSASCCPSFLWNSLLLRKHQCFGN